MISRECFSVQCFASGSICMRVPLLTCAHLRGYPMSVKSKRAALQHSIHVQVKEELQLPRTKTIMYSEPCKSFTFDSIVTCT